MSERNKFLGIQDSGYHPIRKVKVVVSGLTFAMLHDFSVAYKVYTSLVLIVAAGVFQAWVDFIVILLATGLVLTAELLNSAVEGVCDYLEPGPDPRIGTIKDVAAAAVGSASWSGSR